MSCPWENNFSCITQGNSTLSLVFKIKDYYGNIMKQGKHLKQNNEQIKRSRVSVVIKNKQNKRRIKTDSERLSAVLYHLSYTGFRLR